MTVVVKNISMMNTEYLHLNDVARQMMDKSDQERIVSIKLGSWLPYPRAKEILAHMEELYEHPRIDRMPNMLIVGDSNNGKTQILRRFERQHPPDPNLEGDYSIIPVIFVEAPRSADLDMMYLDILRTINKPHVTRSTSRDREAEVYQILNAIQLKVLLIDEIHNLLTGGPAKQREFRNGIKRMGNILKIPIICAGIAEALNAFNTDSQLSNRFEPEFLPKWQLDDEYGDLLRTLERRTPLKNASVLDSNELASKIFWMSEGIMGEMHEVIKRAAVHAIKSGEERIKLDTLDKIRWTQPSKRKNHPTTR